MSDVRTSGPLHQSLLRAYSISDPFICVPLHLLLCDASFILPYEKQPPRRDEAGRLPLMAYLRHYGGRDMGIEFQLTIAGGSGEGLPFGLNDWKVWLAVIWVIDENGCATDGTVKDFSVRRVEDAMGIVDRRFNGERFRIIRDALARIGLITTTFKLTYRPAMLVPSVGRGGQSGCGLEPAFATHEPDPLAADIKLEESTAREQLRCRTKNTYMIRYRWEEDEDRNGNLLDAEIYDLQLNPELVWNISAGWLSWIDRDVVMKLSSIAAFKIYQLVASKMSKGDQGPFKFDLVMLRQYFKVEDDDSATLQDLVMAGAKEAKEAEILERTDWEPCAQPDGGQFTFSPGPLFDLRAALRGTPLLDTVETRVLTWALARLGHLGPTSRSWIKYDKKRVYNALFYHAFRKLHSDRPIVNPTGFVRDAIENGWSWHGARFTDFVIDQGVNPVELMSD